MKKQIIPIAFLFAAILTLGSFSSAHAQANITGKVVPIPIQYTLQIAQNDFPNQMSLADAEKACEALGDGWRLPTKDELNSMYINKNEINGFSASAYWSSSEIGPFGWIQYFNYGGRIQEPKANRCYVRAVRNAL